MRSIPIPIRLPASLAFALLLLAASSSHARAAEHITLTNGFELDCLRHEVMGDTGRVRLYPTGSADPNAANYLEVAASAIGRVEPLADLPQATAPQAQPASTPGPAGLQTMLAHAGAQHNIDTDLLASLVNAESGGHANAVSRAGARGLMQLMPATAASLGVADAFRPEQNIAGGAAYLDHLLTRYHDDVTLALAAYNAGPGAVDRYHGVPPFRETRAYITRIVTEFNRRKRAALQTASLHP